MKILITGISGMLGSDMAEVFGSDELVGMDIAEPGFDFKGEFIRQDFTESEPTYEIVTKKNPDIIIHAGAYTDVDGCQKNPDKAFKVNGIGTRNLVVSSGRFDSVIVYISTDYVFDGSKKGPYREDDEPNPISEYGKSKFSGEKYIRQFSHKYFIVRSSWLFGRNRVNYAQTIKDCLLSGKIYKAAADMKGSPTYTPDLAMAVKGMINTKKFGIYHVTNSGSCTRYEFAAEIESVLKHDKKGKIEKVALDDLSLDAPRPKNSVLDNYCYISECFPKLRNWKDALGEFISKGV